MEQLKQITDNRSIWIDNARCIATIAVIIIHMATPAVVTMYHPDNELNTSWWIGNIYDSLSRFCVPVFVMLTGSLLLPQVVSTKVFITKRLNRLLMPFIFWTLIYIAFNFSLKIRDEGSSQAIHHLGSWLMEQVIGGTAPHLWYIYMITGVYLFIPVIQPWILAASNRAIVVFLVLWLITVIAGQQKLVLYSTPLDLRNFSGYIGYLVLGYYLSERLVITTPLKYWAALIFLVGFMGTLFGTYWYTVNQGAFSSAFYEYLTVNVFFQAAGVFIILKGFDAVQGKLSAANTLRKMISRYGYGIYLGHLLVLSIMAHFNIDYRLITPLIGIPLSSLICLSITYVIIRVINKLPYGKYISG